ncbi:MAG: hypothetical protein D6731_03410 [Planctomycetota bacterium]|nr:MAG: hypothetical protein D6731_03410 [Planctomycetota bacterium]
MSLARRLAGLVRRRARTLLSTWIGLGALATAFVFSAPEHYRAEAVLGADAPGGYAGPARRLVARVNSRSVLLRAAAEGGLLGASGQAAGDDPAPTDALRRLGARFELEGRPGAVQALRVSAQAPSPQGALRAVDLLCRELLDYDRRLRERTLAQRARGEDARPHGAKPARVLLEELRQRHPLLRDPDFLQRHQREAEAIATEELAVLALRKRRDALRARAQRLGELVRREAEVAYRAHREQLARREREAAEAAAREREAREATESAPPQVVAETRRELAAHEEELQRMLATRTRRHPDVRRLLRKIELLRKRASEEAPAPPEGAGTGERSKPVSLREAEVVPIAEPAEDPVALADAPLETWRQQAAHYADWLAAQSEADQASVALEAREQVLLRRKQRHADREKAVQELEVARLEEQRLLARMEEEEALRKAAPTLAPPHEPLLLATAPRVVSSDTPRDYLLPLWVLAGLLAAGAAALAEATDRSFWTLSDVQRTGLPVLGAVPRMRRGR